MLAPEFKVFVHGLSQIRPSIYWGGHFFGVWPNSGMFALPKANHYVVGIALIRGEIVGGKRVEELVVLLAVHRDQRRTSLVRQRRT